MKSIQLLFLSNTALFVLATCAASQSTTEFRNYKGTCLTQEFTNGVTIDFPFSRLAFTEFEKSTAQQEVLVVKLVRGNSRGICRRMIQAGSNFTAITVQEQAGTNTIHFSRFFKPDSIWGRQFSGHYIIQNDNLFDGSYTVVIVKRKGITVSSVAFNDFYCLPLTEQQKIKSLYDVAQYILQL